MTHTVEQSKKVVAKIRQTGVKMQADVQGMSDASYEAAHKYVKEAVSFIARKVLFQQKRDRADRAKGILYIHDTFEAEVLFGNLNDDIRRAAQISEKRRLSPEAIQEACRYGFLHVFA